MCLCETKRQERGIAPFWACADLPEKISRDMGYHSDGVAISRDMVRLRAKSHLCNRLAENFHIESGTFFAKTMCSRVALLRARAQEPTPVFNPLSNLSGLTPI